MPTYHAAGVNIRLSTVPPEDSLSPRILRRLDQEAKKETGRIRAGIATNAATKAFKLSERSMNLSLDSDSDNGDHLHFLGSDRTVPFYCIAVTNPFSYPEKIEAKDVSNLISLTATDMDKKCTSNLSIRARRGSYASQIDNASSELSSLGSTPPCSPCQIALMDLPNAAIEHQTPSRPSKSNLSLKLRRLALLDPRMVQTHSPKPLVLSVNVNNLLSYSRSLDKPPKPSDIRIDVFFNGLLTHSSFLNYKQKDEKNARNETASYFSGLRIERLAEAAWLIFPPTDSATKRAENENLPTAGSLAQQRWDHISTAIRRQANSLGLDEKYSRPPLGDYLRSLSQLPMPSAVTDLVVPNGRTYGVIDVAITLGRGKKFPTSHGFLTTPEILNDYRYELDCSIIDPEPKPKKQSRQKLRETTGENQTLTDGSKPKLCTLASTRSKRQSAPSRLSNVLAMDSVAAPKDSQLQSFSNLPSRILNSIQGPQGTPTPAANELGISWVKRRKLNRGWSLASGLSAYSPVQRLARKPTKETDPVPLGPPRIFFPDHELSYFNGELQSQQNKSIIVTAGTTRKNKKGKKSRILTFSGPKLSSRIESLARADSNTTDELTRDRFNKTWNAVADGLFPNTTQASNSAITQTPVQAKNETKPSMRFSKVKRGLVSALDGPHWSLPVSDASSTQLAPGLSEARKLSSSTTVPDGPFISTPLNAANSKDPKQAKGANGEIDGNPVKTDNFGFDPIEFRERRGLPFPFPIPELSQNCVLSYLSPSEIPLGPGKWRSKKPSEMGAARHRKSERAGEFLEAEVLFGCRYVVGG